MNTYQLFFGRNVPGGGYVTDDGFDKFLRIVDTLVDGYTVVDAVGAWEGERENAKLMTVCTDDVDAVYDIARTYKQAFSQDAVAIQVFPPMEFV